MRSLQLPMTVLFPRQFKVTKTVQDEGNCSKSLNAPVTSPPLLSYLLVSIDTKLKFYKSSIDFLIFYEISFP